MTSSPPVEAPEYRGKTLTPVSPRPVHIPEPSNIPVLENQMDPIFNDTSTYLEHESAPGTVPQQHNMSSFGQPNESITNGGTGGNETHPEIDSGDDGNDDYAMSLELEDQDGSEHGDKLNKPENNIDPQNSGTSQFPTASITPTEVAMTAFAPNNGSSFTNPGQVHPGPTNPHQTFQGATAPNPASSEAVGHDPSNTGHNNQLNQALNLLSQDGKGSDVADGGVNFQALLDNLSPSTAGLPNTEGSTATSAAAALDANVARPNSVQTEAPGFSASANLPARPPPQDTPVSHASYTPGEGIQSYQPQSQNPSSTPSFSQPAASYQQPPGFPQNLIPNAAPGTNPAANGLPPPPLATFQQQQLPASNAPQPSPSTHMRHRDKSERKLPKSARGDDEDEEEPWGPEIQKKYDEFLHDERVYVTEGQWDRFPPNSRLFIGNLPTEKVTKRDLFHIFHHHGKLAQISIKQAYGFVQFLDATACYQALQAEQGVTVRGRKMHLEISKPQKNTRGSGRRSRSPDHGRGGRGNRFGGNDGRDRENRQRDDYRPMRSPSPRGFRGRDEFRPGRDRSRDRYGGRRRSRSISPYGRGSRYRSRSPRGRANDEDAELPLPRRNPRDVPEVQIIVMEELDRNFITYVEKAFIDRGIKSDVVFLNPRLSLTAVIKRQILEGVIAVSQLSRTSQASSKIPLQVFDRKAGADNVRFFEYDNLQPSIAAELVIRAKQTQNVPTPAPYTANTPAYMAPPYGQAQAPTGLPGATPNLGNLLSSLDGATLQKLLGAMQPQSQHHPQAGLQQPISGDLASILSGAGGGGAAFQQQQPQQTQQAPAPQMQQYGNLAANPALAGNPALASLLGGMAGRQPAAQSQQAAPAQQVQNIMEQLAKWKQ